MYQETSYKSTFYVFGATFKNGISYLIDPPSRFLCQIWSLTKADDTFGKFKQSDKSVWNTDNEIDVTYNWPTTSSG